MKVYFIGAGPGAADLITLRAKTIIERAPVIIYAGSLVPEDLLRHAAPTARRINTAPLSLEEIIHEFEKANERGEDVARLHSGDPSLYSAVHEQIAHLNERGIAYEIIPGVPAYAAAAAACGRELTVPEINQTLILTRVEGRASKMPAGEQLANLGRSEATLAIHLAAAQSEKIIAELSPHYGADCPVIIAAHVSRPDEKIITTTLAELTGTLEAHQIKRTAIIFVGRALAAEAGRTSALYDKSHARHLKPAADE